MAGKFSMPRFDQEDLESTQELPQLPQDFEPLPGEPVFEYTPQPVYDAEEEYDPDEDYNPDEELPEDFIDTALRFGRQALSFCAAHGKSVALGLCALVLVIVVSSIGLSAVEARDPYDEKILNNVMIADVLVGGMQKEEAAAALNAGLANAYATQTMTVDLGEQVIKLEPQQVNARLNVQAAVDAAYNYGRTGTEAEREQAYQTSLSGNHIMAVLPYLELNEDYIRQTLEAIETASVSQLTQPTYTLEGEGEVVDLSAEVFDPEKDPQTLVITLGTPQVDFDAEKVFDQVIDAYSLGIFRVEAQGPVTSQVPETLDLEAIYKEFFREPKDPTLDMTDFDAIPGSYGREFDLGEAKMQLLQAQYGETIRIPMTFPAPEGDPTSVLYRDVLGEWSTSYPDDDSWKQNLRQACKAISGTTLNPGEVFSFNSVVGKRSESRGYVEAPSCDGEDHIKGGGVCQLASTLYVTALLSDLDITARSAHKAPPAYTEYGTDAQVDWDGADLSFRNSTIYPIRIQAEATGGYVKVKIIGTDMRSYTTEMEVAVSETIQPKIIYEEYDFDNDDGYEDGDVIQDGRNGYQVKTYKRKYDKQSGTLSSREFVANSSYPSRNKVIARVAPPVTETEEPTLPPSETVPITLPTEEETGETGELEAVG